MIFVRLDDGTKCIRYYDKATRCVKRSQNFKFNKNEEPHNMEIVELSSLQAEGEKLDDSPLQTTQAEPETHQLNFRHRTIEFTDAPKDQKAPSCIKPSIIPSEPPDVT